ncbi:MAG TPA: hypothetical protein VNA26_09380, partial [Chitinophagaceae bacterium]|nr:hypothetical protein [Chitinophagaceae bacterium]
DIDQETLLLYLQGKLSAEKQHELEKKLMDSDFETEALEGLQKIKDQQGVSAIIEQLNRELKKKTQKRKQRKEKFRLNTDPTVWVTIIIILFLIIISYLVITSRLPKP